MPWEVRPSSHFTALFEAQVLVMAMSGMTVRAISAQVRESDSRVWAMLGRAVSEAREGADYSGVTRVGVDDTAPRPGPALHIGDGGPRRPQGGRRHRGQGPRRARAGSATSSRRGAATARP